jgi:hypothetical protein
MIKMENVKDLAKELSNSFDKVMKLNADLLKTLNEDQLKQVLPMQNDINSILNAVKKGDILAINEIQKRYADSNIR